MAATSLLLASPDARATECSPWSRGTLVSPLSDDAIDESSGLAASWRDDDLLWTHNDSGDEARLFVLRQDGTVLSTVSLPEIDATDWEDLAIAPCQLSDKETPCLYIGDIGDNLARRDHVTIYRTPEPAFDAAPEDRTLTAVDRLRFRYPDGPRDAEALLVHPRTLAIFVVEKTSARQSNVYRIPPAFGEDITTAEHVATLTIDHSLSFGRMITAGDFSPDGRELTLRTYLDLHTYCSSDEDEPAAAFQASPAVTSVPFATLQSEALTYDRQDDALWLTSERLPAPLIRVPRAPESIDEPSPDDADTGAGGDGDEPGDSAPADASPPPRTEIDASTAPDPGSAAPIDRAGCTCHVVSSSTTTTPVLAGWALILLSLLHRRWTPRVRST